jgi:dihydroorotase
MNRGVTRALGTLWVVDPVAGLAGAATVEVRDGRFERVDWRDGVDAASARFRSGGEPERGDPIDLLLPALFDLHAHFRQPGAAASEDAASGERAAAHGGFGTVCLMPNSDPAADSAEILQSLARIDGARRGVRLLPIGAATRDRAGTALAPLAELAAAGAVAFSDDGSPIADPALMRAALIGAGALGLPIVEHAEVPHLTLGGEAADGAVATRLGLRPWPAAGEIEAVSSDIAMLREALAIEPRARLHLTHLSTAAALDLVRAARVEGLPVSCDVTPHHIAFTDRWIEGDRRWAWEQAAESSPEDYSAPYPTTEAFDSNLRVCPPLRGADDAAACRAALRDGTALAIATDHAPHARERKEVEFGRAANGIAGIETALSVALAARAAGELSLATIAAAFVTGPASLLPAAHAPRGIRVGAPADLVAVAAAASWTPNRDTLAGRSLNTPLIGRTLPGVVRLTLVNGVVAWEAPGD